jgi:quercetin dioxygenase-like cupin family protein
MDAISLVTLGRSLPIDADHRLRQVEGGTLLLLHLKPQEYAEETHAREETIIVLEGTCQLVTREGVTEVKAGMCLHVPPGVPHRFGEASDAVLLTLTGTSS